MTEHSLGPLKQLAERIALDAQTCIYVHNMRDPLVDSNDARERYIGYLCNVIDQEMPGYAELLDACKMLLGRELEVIGSEGSPFCVDEVVVARARAAIAKAEGSDNDSL